MKLYTFKSFIKKIDFKKKLKKIKKLKNPKILIAWNRGLGDIPLGLYSIIKVIKQTNPSSQITFVTRKNLKEGFDLLKEDIKVLIDNRWERHKEINIKNTLYHHNLKPSNFDIIFKKPNPTYWSAWQLKTLTPKLYLPKNIENTKHLKGNYIYIGVQPLVESQHSYWRDWPLQYWSKLFKKLEEYDNIKIVLLGYTKNILFFNKNIIDLRGQTSLTSLLAIIKKCKILVLPDSGILSILYYITNPIPINVISLWADPNQGILKQGVKSPNNLLNHFPIISKNVPNITEIKAEDVLNKIKPLLK